MKKRNFNFILSDGNKIEISLTQKQLLKFPEQISDDLFSNDSYCIQSKVQPTVFKSFIDHFLYDDKDLIINENNILQIQLLNEEFNVPFDIQSIPEHADSFNERNVLYYILLIIYSFKYY